MITTLPNQLNPLSTVSKKRLKRFITIMGLAVGMALCLLFLLWVRHEVSFDRFHQYANRIYRVAQKCENGGKLYDSALSPAPLGPALMREFPWVEKTVYLHTGTTLFKGNDKLCLEDVIYTSSDILDFFTFPLVKGNSKTALKNPYSVVISETIMYKYFGGDIPVGQTVILEKEYKYTITGVFKDIPSNSHLRFNLLCRRPVIAGDAHNFWGSKGYTYIMVKENSPSLFASLNGSGPLFLIKHKQAYFLQPLTRIHLLSNLRNELDKTGSILMVFISVALVVILLQACIYYFMLSTERFRNREKEAAFGNGVASYSGKSIKNHFIESIAVASMTAFASVLIAVSVLPLFNRLVNKPLAFDFLDQPDLLVWFVCIIFGVGLIAGIYPAIKLFPVKGFFRKLVKKWINPVESQRSE